MPESVSFPAVRCLSAIELSPRTRSYYKKIDFMHRSDGTAIVMFDFHCCFDFGGRTPPSDLLVMEKETSAVLEGDFEDQFPTDVGHNPSPIYLPVFWKPNVQIHDLVGFSIDTQKRC
jgi:hypothetical protein